MVPPGGVTVTQQVAVLRTLHVPPVTLQSASDVQAWGLHVPPVQTIPSPVQGVPEEHAGAGTIASAQVFPGSHSSPVSTTPLPQGVEEEELEELLEEELEELLPGEELEELSAEEDEPGDELAGTMHLKQSSLHPGMPVPHDPVNVCIVPDGQLKGTAVHSSVIRHVAAGSEQCLKPLELEEEERELEEESLEEDELEELLLEEELELEELLEEENEEDEKLEELLEEEDEENEELEELLEEEDAEEIDDSDELETGQQHFIPATAATSTGVSSS
ncbi:MAG: hypothetical protein V1926_04320 [Candidatus Peregrinibacteria bacterium]